MSAKTVWLSPAALVAAGAAGVTAAMTSEWSIAGLGVLAYFAIVGVSYASAKGGVPANPDPLAGLTGPRAQGLARVLRHAALVTDQKMADVDPALLTNVGELVASAKALAHRWEYVERYLQQQSQDGDDGHAVVRKAKTSRDETTHAHWEAALGHQREREKLLGELRERCERMAAQLVSIDAVLGTVSAHLVRAATTDAGVYAGETQKLRVVLHDATRDAALLAESLEEVDRLAAPRRST